MQRGVLRILAHKICFVGNWVASYFVLQIRQIGVDLLKRTDLALHPGDLGKVFGTVSCDSNVCIMAILDSRFTFIFAKPEIYVYLRISDLSAPRRQHEKDSQPIGSCILLSSSISEPEDASASYSTL